jgi:hypothetical protein
MAPKSAPSQRHGLSSKSVRNLSPPNHHGKQQRSSNNTCSDNSLDEQEQLYNETDDEAQTRRLIKALAEQSYHLPGTYAYYFHVRWSGKGHATWIFFCMSEEISDAKCNNRLCLLYGSISANALAFCIRNFHLKLSSVLMFLTIHLCCLFLVTLCFDTLLLLFGYSW